MLNLEKEEASEYESSEYESSEYDTDYEREDGGCTPSSSSWPPGFESDSEPDPDAMPGTPDSIVAARCE